MKDLFDRISVKSADTDFSLTVSYLEIYNETIRDLLAPENGPLQLREANGMATPAGLSTKEPTSATDVVEWITLGNQNRTVNATEANATSSRSHAVLRVTVQQKPKAGGMNEVVSSASLSVIDLAGSERASVTKNKGDRLIEGANINRSLLALGNCINALCDPRKRGHVPYRDSKLTRLLKQSLGGNCKTVMIVCVSPSSAHYDETHNTLQYANRAKEIKTKAIRNIITVDRHVGQYCQQILEQGQEILRLKAELAVAGGGAGEREADARAVTTAKAILLRGWEAGRDRFVQSERARVERDGIDAMLEILRRWRSKAFGMLEVAGSPGTSIESASPTTLQVKTNCDSLIANLYQSSSHLRSTFPPTTAAESMTFYAASLTSQSVSIRSKHPHALPHFLLEAQLLQQRLDVALADARELGAREDMKVQARVMHAMCEARAKVGSALHRAREDSSDAERALRRLANGIDVANAEAFLSLSSSGAFVGVKRDAGTRSPLDPTEEWASVRKVAKASEAGFGSTSGGMLAASSTSMAAGRKSPRKSPRKGVSFQPTRAARSSPKKVRKEVQWRDETGDGWELEDFKTRSPETPEMMGSSSTSANPFLVVSPPAPIVTSWTSTSSAIHGPSSTAAEMMAATVKARSSATGSLRNKVAASRASPLPTLSESSKPFSFHRDDFSSMPPPPAPSSSRSPFLDIGNTSSSSEGPSFSMAPTPSGLFAPIVSAKRAPTDPETPRRAAARRRISHIGPQRSAKPNRRTSFIPPPTPAGTSLANGLRLKPSRPPGASSFAAPPSARKSPRKVASSRRASVAIGGGPSVSFPGAASAARIAARRESTLAGSSGSMAGSSASMAGPLKARESLMGSAGASKGSVWR